jgi:hypothetical protein
VRFVEVVVNGPKSWSLAAALHPDVTAAYAAAQDRAAVQVIHWLAQHATSRVGPRDKQVQLPVEMLEAVTRGGLVRGLWRRRSSRVATLPAALVRLPTVQSPSDSARAR